MADRPYILFHILQNLRTSVQPHGKLLQASILYLQILPDIPPSCPARYPSTSELLDFFWTLFWSHSLVSVTYITPGLATVLKLYLGVSLHTGAMQGVISGISLWLQVLCSENPRPWPPTHLTNIAAHLSLLILSP